MMMNLSEFSPRELERLSEYLDGALSPKEAARLEARLRDEPELRAALEQMRETVWLLRSVPEVQPSRSFTLSPEMVGRRERSRAYPRLQLATALVAAAFVFVIGVDLFGSTGVLRGMAPAAEKVVADEVAPMEAPIIEKEAQEVGEVLEGEFFGGEEDMALAEPEMEAPATPEEVEEAKEGLNRYAVTEATEVPPAEAEEEYRAEAPPVVGTEEVAADTAAISEEEPAAEETGMVAGVAEVEEVPPATEQIVSPPSEVGVTEFETEIRPPIIHPLRILEIGLGLLFILLLILTLAQRRKPI